MDKILIKIDLVTLRNRNLSCSIKYTALSICEKEERGRGGGHGKKRKRKRERKKGRSEGGMLEPKNENYKIFEILLYKQACLFLLNLNFRHKRLFTSFG